MPGRRKHTFPGWMPGLYRVVGKRKTAYYTIPYQHLGHDLVAARRKLLELQDGQAKPGSVAEMLDEELARREKRVAAGKLAKRTLEDNKVEAERLKKVLGEMKVEDVRKAHVYRYLHKERASAPIRANREIALLQSAFGPLIATEVLTSNPCESVERNEETPRTRKVTRDELYGFLEFARKLQPRIANALELSYLTTKAQGQVLSLTRTRLKEEGIEWPMPRKKGAPTLTEWTPALRECVRKCLAEKSKVDTVYVIYNRQGQPYSPSGFKTMQNRLMKLWVKEGHEHFTFHDAGRAAGITRLREEKRSASEVSGHMQEKTVTRVYDRRTFRKAKAVE